MPKVKVSSTFIGSLEEMAAYGGQVPSEWKKREKKMGTEERKTFNMTINVGTELEVSDKRAKELAKLGLIENPDKYWTKADVAAEEKSKVRLNVTEKVSNVKPTAKAETLTIPSAKTAKVTKVVKAAKKPGGK